MKDLKGKKYDLLQPIAKGISSHISSFGFQNNPILEISTRNIAYMSFSSEEFGTMPINQSERYVRDMLEDYSFSVDTELDLKSMSINGFPYEYDLIKVIFYRNDLIKNKEKLKVIGKSFSSITKFGL